MLYLIRHGESMGNASHRHQTPDVPLSELGKEQALLRAHTLKDKNINKIFVSPYTRALQTGSIIQAELGMHVPLTIHEDLREVRNPSALDGRLKTDPDVMQIKAEIKCHCLDPNYRHSDEETLFMLYQRIIRLLDFCSSLSDTDVLLVSHGGVLQMVLAHIQTQTDAHSAVARQVFLREDKDFEIKNLAMIALDYQHHEWQFNQLDNLC